MMRDIHHSIDEALVQRARGVRIEDELARRGINNLRRVGKELIGACPICKEGDDRFSVSTVKQVWNCRKCGLGGDVIELVQELDNLRFPAAVVQLADEPQPQAGGKAPAKPKPKPNGGARHEPATAPETKPKRVLAATYDYPDEAGDLLFQVRRIEFQDAAGNFVLEENGKRVKTFRQRQPDAQRPGEWLPNVDGVRPVPYRLPELLEALGNEHTIFIAEGERKVDLLRSWNVPATCCAGGAEKWKPEHSEFLRGANVVILPDHDAPGRRHADVVATSLQGIAARVRVVTLSGLREKEDIIDWAAQAHTREELDALVEAVADWRPNGPPAASEADYGINEPAPGPKASQQSRPGLTICSSAQFIKDFIPPDYLLDGILQRRFVYSFTGKTGSGKTALLTFLAASVALPRAIGPHAVEKGRAVYFAGGNPDDVRMRWIALSQQMDFDVNQIDVHFIPGVFKISQLMDEIKTEVAALGGASLIIVDTSAAYFEGDDENANKAAGDHARRFRELTTLQGGPCVVVACHPPKNAADDNLQPRGGGAFIAEMDGNLTASIEGTVVEMHWQGKYRGPDFAPITFLLRTVTHERLKDTKGRTVPTVVAAHLSEASRTELAATARTNEDQLLAALADNGRASLADLAKALGWVFRSGLPNKMLVKRTLAKLKKHKLVSDDRDGPALTDAGKKALK